MRKLLVFAVAISEVTLIGLLVYVNFFTGTTLDIYDRVSLSLVLCWMSIIICYLAWAVYFYSFNFGRSTKFWERFRETTEKYKKRPDKTESDVYKDLEAPRTNPYADETFGMPPGTIRGTLALTILMGGIALFVSLFSEDSPFGDTQFYSYFQFFEDAFLMVIAFYFGTKGLDIITRQRSGKASQPAFTPPAPIEQPMPDEEDFDFEETPAKKETSTTKAVSNGQDDKEIKPKPPRLPSDLKEQLIDQHYPHVKDTERGKFLTEEDINEFAEAWQLEVPVVQSVLKVESSGKGFLKDGRPKILFEGHVFWKQLKAVGLRPEDYADKHADILYPSWTKVHYKGGKGEYHRLERAQRIHEEAALSSASWGLFQIMGYHYKNLEYPSITEFVQRQALNEYEHLEAFGRFIKRFDLLEALRNKEWAKFARGYNGKGYAANQYDVKLERYYHEFSQQTKPVI